MFKHKAVVLFTAFLCLILFAVATSVTFEDTMIPREVATLTAEMALSPLDLSASSGSELSAFVEESSGITVSAQPTAVVDAKNAEIASKTNTTKVTRRGRRGRGRRSNRRRRGARRNRKGRRGARRGRKGRGRARRGRARRGRKGRRGGRKVRRSRKGAKRSRKGGKRGRKGGKNRKARRGGKNRKNRKARRGRKGGKNRKARRGRKGGKRARRSPKGKGKKKLTKEQAARARFLRASARMRRRRARRQAPFKGLKPFQGETYAPNGPIARLNKNKHPLLDPIDPKSLVKKTAALRKILAKRRAELKRKRAEQSNAAKRRAAAARARFRRLRRVRGYGKSIRPGNFMTGGPIAKPAHRPRNWLQQYQERIVARQSGTDNNSVARRRAVLTKMVDLYEKAKPTDMSFLTEFLGMFGSRVPTDKIQQEWTAARNWLRQARLREAEQDKRETKLLNTVVTKKDRKEKEVVHSLPAIKRIFTKTEGPAFKAHLKVVEDLEDPLLARDFPDLDDGKTRKSNWWGCLDCESSSPSSKGKKGRRGSRRNPMSPKRKGPKSGRGMGHAKGVSLPNLDLSVNNEALIDHLLERMNLRRDPAMVKQRTKDVMDRLKTRIAEAMLTPAERNDLALAKVEALEKTVAYNSGAVKMVKRGELHHVKARRNRWPSTNPPDAKEAENPDREVDIHFGMGYIRAPFRTDRDSLDIASADNEKAMDFHDDIKRQHNHYTKTVVWRQFEGKGDDEQQRAIKINAHRKKYPNQPMDGKMPW